MPDREKVINGLECCMKWTGEPNTATCHCSDCSYTNMDVFGERCLIDLINDALALLKEQEGQKWKWLQTIADTQLAISPTGYESEDEMAKRGWEWNGLQMAWEIIAGEERSEHPRLVRCKDCKHNGNTKKCIIASYCELKGEYPFPFLTNDWFCADGERK